MLKSNQITIDELNEFKLMLNNLDTEKYKNEITITQPFVKYHAIIDEAPNIIQQNIYITLKSQNIIMQYKKDNLFDTLTKHTSLFKTIFSSTQKQKSFNKIKECLMQINGFVKNNTITLNENEKKKYNNAIKIIENNNTINKNKTNRGFER